MYYLRFVYMSFLFVATILSIVYPNPAHAQYEPPSDITLNMYRLTQSGNIASPRTLCIKDEPDIAESYGCTAITDNPSHAYPFNSSTIAVDIDGTAADNRYLRDVVAQEMSPSTHLLSALTAQAIAARTYAYWHIRTDAIQPGAINNSTEYQVFLPYRYDTFDTTERAAIDAAVAARYYMSYQEAYSVSIYGQTLNLSANDPIFAEFSADVPERTIDSPTFTYVKGVADPISLHPDVPTNGNSRGLIQAGAGRWARGSTSFRCEPAPAPCAPPPSVPHTAWSVRWENALQILTHYYTGIHIRDANDNNRIVTPNRRWVPLRIFGQETPR